MNERIMRPVTSILVVVTMLVLYAPKATEVFAAEFCTETFTANLSMGDPNFQCNEVHVSRCGANNTCSWYFLQWSGPTGFSYNYRLHIQTGEFVASVDSFEYDLNGNSEAGLTWRIFEIGEDGRIDPATEVGLPIDNDLMEKEFIVFFYGPHAAFPPLTRNEKETHNLSLQIFGTLANDNIDSAYMATQWTYWCQPPEIPTLNTWGLMLLGALILGLAMTVLYRRRRITDM